MDIFNFLKDFDLSLVLRVFATILVVVVLYLILSWLLSAIQKKLFKRAKNKKEKSNIKIFFQVARYIIVLLLVVFAILSYTGSLTGIGITAGLLSAALGWALQRPITGMAAWLMVVIKRPFEIGDRIIIGSVKGDVIDITLTHIHIGEIGGTIASEEISGRVILIPNAKLFEQDIVNYTEKDELILDQVKFTATFESDIEKAKEYSVKAVKEVFQDYMEEIDKEPYTRTWFNINGINVIVRYFVSAPIREEVSSRIVQQIFNKVVHSHKKVEFAYQHNEVLLRKKK